jgi:hypothetical protein
MRQGQEKSVHGRQNHPPLKTRSKNTPQIAPFVREFITNTEILNVWEGDREYLGRVLKEGGLKE